MSSAALIDLEDWPDATEWARRSVESRLGRRDLLKITLSSGSISGVHRQLADAAHEGIEEWFAPFRLRFLKTPWYWAVIWFLLTQRGRARAVLHSGTVVHPLVPLLAVAPFLQPLIACVLLVKSPVYLYREVICKFAMTPDPHGRIVGYGEGRSVGGVIYWKLLADKSRKYGLFGLAHDTYMGNPLGVHCWPAAMLVLRALGYRAFIFLSAGIFTGAVSWISLQHGAPWFIALMPLILGSTFFAFNVWAGTWELLAWGFAALAMAAYVTGFPVVAGILTGLVLLAHPGVAQLSTLLLAGATAVGWRPWSDLFIAATPAALVAIPFIVPYWRSRGKLGRNEILNTISRPSKSWDLANGYQLVSFTALPVIMGFSTGAAGPWLLLLLPVLLHAFNTKVSWVFSAYTVSNFFLVTGAIFLAAFPSATGIITYLIVIFTSPMLLAQNEGTPLSGFDLTALEIDSTARRVREALAPLTEGRIGFESDGLGTKMSSYVAAITYIVRDLPIELLNGAYAEIGDAAIYRAAVQHLNASATEENFKRACRVGATRYVVTFSTEFRQRLGDWGGERLTEVRDLELGQYPGDSPVSFAVYVLPEAASVIEPRTSVTVTPNRIRFLGAADTEYLLRYSAFKGWRATSGGVHVPIDDAQPGMRIRTASDGIVEISYKLRHYFGV